MPGVITFADGNTITYGYDATGSKLSIAYTAGGTTTKTEYAGNKVYRDGTLSMILTEEGYITLSGTTPTYHYYLNDHQGNNRVVLNQSGAVEQVNHYYPFGGLFGEGVQTENQPYRYNGKELDRELGLDMYDYGARHYDAAIGRWLTVDLLAEKYYSISPYAYVANNPVRFIDPEGMRLDDIIIREKEKTVTIVKQNENVDRIFDKNNPQGKEIEKGSFDLDKYSDVGYSIETLSSVGMGMTDFVASSVMGGVILSKVGGLISKGISALKAGQAAKAIGTNAAKGGIEAANGLKITGFTGHGVDRAIGSFGRSGVKPDAIFNALKNPLKINNVVTDQFGRQSQRFIGQFGEVVINPQTGKIISVNPTSSSKAAKLLKQLGQ